MRRRTLGRTGLEVSELSLGGVFLSSAAAPYEEAERNVRAAVECGVDLFDTAPGYHDSEAVLGRALAALGPAGREVTVCTKLGGRHGEPFDARDPAVLRTSIETSLRALGRDVLDVLLIHEPDRDAPHAWWPEDGSRAPVLDVLDEARAAGKVRFVGLGGTTAYEMSPLIRSGAFDVVLTAFQYSLLYREATHDLIPAALERELGLVLGSPLMQGLFTARRDALLDDPACTVNPPRRAQLRALYALLDETGLELPEMALRFALSHEGASSVLTGAAHADQMRANAAAASRGPLPPDVLRRLDEIAALVPFRPFRENPGDPFQPPV